MTPDQEQWSILDKSTLVPLGVVVAVVLAVAGGVVWLNDRLLRIENGIAMLSKDVEAGSANRWTSTEMRMWVRLLKAENPELSVPFIEDTPLMRRSK